MKRHGNLVALFLGLGLLSVQARADLVAYWPMDEGSGATAANVAGGGLSGTLPNAGANTWAPGHGGTGYALNFNGVNQYMAAGTNATLDAVDNQVTLGTWVKTNFAGTWFRAVASKFGDSAISNFWGLGWEATNQLGFIVRDTSNAAIIPNTPAGWGADNQWHYLLGTRDKTGSAKVSFYADGDLVQEQADTIGSVANTRPFQVARHGGGQYVSQTVDDMAIWNTPLTPFQVRALARGQVTPLTAASATNDILRDTPVGYWQFEESRTIAGSNLAADSTGAGRTGTFSSPTITVSRPIESNGFNRAVKFDGTDNSVTFPTIKSADFGGGGSYSAELWFNADTRQQGDILSMSNGGGHMMLLELETNGQIRFLHRSPAATGGGQNVYAPAGSYAPGQWNHLAAVDDAGTLMLYLNGQLMGTATGAPAYTQDLSLVLGRILPGDSARSFQGYLDEVALYNYALSPGQIMEHIALGVPEPLSAVMVLMGLAGVWQRARRRRMA